jgi:hypothetical protein
MTPPLFHQFDPLRLDQQGILTLDLEHHIHLHGHLRPKTSLAIVQIPNYPAFDIYSSVATHLLAPPGHLY